MKLFGLIPLPGVFSGSSGKSPEGLAEFGEKVKFSLNAPVQFKDLTLTLTGERRVSSEIYPRGFLYYDFLVETDREEKLISWSSGTGEIAPAVFQIDGQNYELELAVSDKLGKLAGGEFVIRKK